MFQLFSKKRIMIFNPSQRNKTSLQTLSDGFDISGEDCVVEALDLFPSASTAHQTRGPSQPCTRLAACR